MTTALQRWQPEVDAAVVVQALTDLHAVAWADFARFLAGWCPDHPKQHAYTQAQVAAALQQPFADGSTENDVFQSDQFEELPNGLAAPGLLTMITPQAEAMQQGAITRESKAAGGTAASEVVTVVDRTAQEIILKALALALTERYELAVLAEESADSGERLHHRAFWAIDPLDGTLFFVEGKSGYSGY